MKGFQQIKKKLLFCSTVQPVMFQPTPFLIYVSSIGLLPITGQLQLYADDTCLV